MVSEGGVITKRLIQKIEPTSPIQPRLLRVAAYARVSSGKDAMLHSLSAQVSYYNELIQGNPEWLFCGIYADEALTGTKSNRAEFQKMLAACRNGEIDLVITKSISRFARNTVDTLTTVRNLKKKGVEVFFEKEFAQLGAKVLVATVDGSYGTRGFVTDAIGKYSYTYFYTCGPEPMLKAVYNSSATSGQFSFEERMGCGFGACMGCSCETKYGKKRICKDGPVLTKEEIIW